MIGITLLLLFATLPGHSHEHVTEQSEVWSTTDPSFTKSDVTTDPWHDSDPFNTEIEPTDFSHELDSINTASNLALGRFTTQSSTFDKFGDSGNAVDGHSSNVYMDGHCAHTDLDIEPWWMVNLNATYKVFSVSVTNRGDCCHTRINSAEIRIGNSEKHGGTKNPRCAVISSLELGETHSFDCKGMVGQYVTITIPRRVRYLTLCEVEVFGLPVSSDYHNDTYVPVQSPDGENSSDELVTELKNILKHSNAAPNVAVGGISSQSSTYDANGHSENAVDDHTAQCSRTKQEFEPWWTVDLKSVFRVFSVAVTSRGDCCNEQINGTQILIGHSAEGRKKNPSCATITSMELGETLSFDCAGMEGRYVTLMIPNRNETLTVCEVQVFGLSADLPGHSVSENFELPSIPHGAPNLALHGRTSQSSYYSYRAQSRKAIDGSLASNYLNGDCTHTIQEFEPWWMVDLQAPAKVFSVAVTNRGDCCKERINNAEIRVGNSKENGGKTNPRCGTVFRMDYGETLSFYCKGMQGQYISVIIPERKDYLTLCEVQVFGLQEPGFTPKPFEDYEDLEPVPEPLPRVETHEVEDLRRKVFHFPEETNFSYVLLFPKKPLRLRAFTLCMRLATDLPRNREIIFFSHRTQYFDELTLWQELDGRFGFYLSGEGLLFEVSDIASSQTHLCLSWQSKSGLTELWINGKKVSRKFYRAGHEIQPNGITMLGQDQDSLGGDFDAKQSFVGQTTDLYMWNYVLPSYFIRKANRGYRVPRGNIFDWRSLSYELKGNVVIQQKNTHTYE
uniref:Pentraxin fusion protein-like n=1 Tax=Geotrypetes seraphini TaxID=260995 RepID=A0A6P8QC59_GEOSA|nr:pentraxin fusion protein-like [Geotrypetes seraphini]